LQFFKYLLKLILLINENPFTFSKLPKSYIIDG